jgi:lipoprotein-anchoring transpeptidase ErfK/SrfK
MTSALAVGATLAALTSAQTPAHDPAPAYDVARVTRPVTLRARPTGPVLARLGEWTEFGSAQTLGVVRKRGAWLAVVSTTRPNGSLAWVRARDVRVTQTRVSLRLDLSRRLLVLRKGDRVVRRMTVGVGRPGSPTPTGRFAITDKLPGARYGPYYGCCILALSAHQTHLPPGWTGGNRIAIHGTNASWSIGAASSAGCPHASDADLRVLMRRVPLGTPVFIRA